MGTYENLYGRFLDEVVGCHEDTLGNRPCDCGILCDKCMDDYYVETWKEWKESHK